ncbi:MAG: hypothetical protein GF331_24790 [Chitinivibrionales bacterium]|nr:hypothetical protein [Chitinivibrionales bacterium]
MLETSSMSANLFKAAKRFSTTRPRTAIFVAALLLRLGWVVLVADFLPVSDSAVYLKLGAEIAETGQYRNAMDFEGHVTYAYRPPGYPFFIALMHRLTDDPLVLIQLVQSVLSALVCVLLYGFLERTTGRRDTAATGALLYCLYPASIAMSAVIWSETVSAFLTVGAFCFATTAGSWRRTLVSGLFLSAACYFRPNTLLLAPMMYLPLLLERKHAAYIARTAALVVLLAAATAPWSVRNHARIGKFVWISSNLGPNVYYGHNPESTGGPYNTERMGEVLDKMDGDEVEKGRILMDEALAYARQHPGIEAVRFVERFVVLLLKDRAPVYLSFVKKLVMTFSTGVRIIGVLNNVFYLAILIAAVSVVLDKRYYRHRFIFGFAGAFTIQVLFYAALVADERYKFPMVPLLFAVASLRVVDLRPIVERRLRRAWRGVRRGVERVA